MQEGLPRVDAMQHVSVGGWVWSELKEGRSYLQRQKASPERALWRADRRELCRCEGGGRREHGG